MNQKPPYTEGERLKRWLKRNGITQSHVARKLHVSRNTIVNWCERDELQPNMLKALAEEFPDIVDEFAHVAGWLYRGAAVQQISKALEPRATYGLHQPTPESQCNDLLHEMSRNYMRLQQRYDEVVTELLQYKDTYGTPAQPGAKSR